MSAQIKLLGILKSYVGGQNQVEVDAGNTVRETMRALNIPSDLVALVMVNDQPQSKDYRVQAGDVITLMAIIGGGQEKICFLWSDAWLLLAIIYSAKKKPAVMSDIIAAADFIQHAVVTFEEMEGALARLVAAGYIGDQDGKFFPTAKTLALYRSITKPQRMVLREAEAIESILRVKPREHPSNPRRANRSMTYPSLTRPIFEQAVQDYLSKFSVKKKRKTK